MLLYLLRHADAKTIAPTDYERPLSAKGIEQAKHMGNFCAAAGIKPGKILTSPLLRAQETANHFAFHLGDIEPEVAGFLASGMDPESAFEALSRYQHSESVMIVGHEPDFSMLCAYLLGMHAGGRIHIR